jgi:predicted amidohydrolase YtcJ
VLRSRPISLKRVDGHAAWVSPEVLRMMEPIPETVDGGQIIRDESGKPTGGTFPFVKLNATNTSRDIFG